MWVLRIENLDLICFVCSVECGDYHDVTYFISNVNSNSRPGEKFEKFKVAKKRHGSDMNMDDLTASTAATQGPSDGVDDENDCIVRMDSSACVQHQMRRHWDLGDCDVIPLAVKTPREASHLAK